MKYFIYIFYNGKWHMHSGWTNLNIAKMRLHELQQLNPNVLMTIDFFDPNEIGVNQHDHLNIINLKSYVEAETQDAEYWQDIALTFKEQNEELKAEIKLANDSAKIIEANADFWHNEYTELKNGVIKIVEDLRGHV